METPVITRQCVCADGPDAWRHCACPGCTAARIAANSVRMESKRAAALLNTAVDLLAFPVTQNDISAAARHISAAKEKVGNI